MKKFLYFTLFILCMAGLSSGTAAVISVSSPSHNVVTSGSVDIAIEQWQETEQGLRAFPDQSIPVMPGKAVSNIVAVRNLSQTSFIRTAISVIFTDENGITAELSGEERDKVLQLTMNTGDWKRKSASDRWWYYAASVEKNGTTEPLFTGLQFSGPGMDNRFQNGKIHIRITAQAVQAANNGTSVWDVVGWPADQSKES